MEISLSQTLGVLAGVLILLIGIFVLKAKPGSALHRLFCAFAVADGVSNIAFNLSAVPMGTAVQLHARLIYVHSFIAFIALLAGVAIVFPRPVLPVRWRRPGLIAIAALGGALVAWHALDPYAFWTGNETASGVVFTPEAGGLFLITAWLLLLVAIVLRVTHLYRTEPSASHRLQASAVLGGMALGYAPYATTNLLIIARFGTAATLTSPRPGVAPLYWAMLAVALAILYAGLNVILRRREGTERERSLLLYCFAGVVLLTVPTVLFEGRAVSALLQQIGLVAWPVLLAYAIARYEVLDIGPAVRRTATISLATTVLATAFFVAEAILENALQTTFAGTLGAPIIAVFIAAAVTALVFAPISAAAKRLAKRFAPEVEGDALRPRQLEIYRHGVEAAVADGDISLSENRVLTAMRTSFGISEEDHARILGEARAKRARPALA